MAEQTQAVKVQKQLSSNAKKVIILCSMVALVALTGVLNIALNSDWFSKTNDGGDQLTGGDSGLGPMLQIPLLQGKAPSPGLIDLADGNEGIGIDVRHDLL